MERLWRTVKYEYVYLQEIPTVQEEWSGLRLPESGDYIVPGALVPVQVDVERDCAVYVEPNVWMLHPVRAE